jgi:alpha-tubulin suppressor-like RCC1 family protein
LTSWGDNTSGQLDNGQVGGDQNTPGLADGGGFRLRQVTSGCDHGVALTSDGEVLAWGANDKGQLGQGAISDPQSRPFVVVIPATIKSIRSGCSFSMALDTAGHVWTWGLNTRGELGTGNDADFAATPHKVTLPRGTVVKAIGAGEAFGVALTRSGKLFSWGNDIDGQLGDGHRTPSAVPVPVHLASGTKIAAVSAGGDHALAVTTTGHVLAWGDNQFGQLGDGTRHERGLPVRIRMPASVQKVTQVFGGGLFSLALTAKGRLLSWGDNGFGELGIGNKTDHLTPVRVHQGSTSVTTVAAGALHVLARTSGGGILAWGHNSNGELGNNSNSDSSIAVPIPLGGVAAVGAGNSSFSSFAILR